MAKQKDPNAKRRPRTTMVMIAVPTTFTEIGKLLGVGPATIAGRYHRIHDVHPKSAVTLQALAEPHRRGSKPYEC